MSTVMSTSHEAVELNEDVMRMVTEYVRIVQLRITAVFTNNLRLPA